MENCMIHLLPDKDIISEIRRRAPLWSVSTRDEVIDILESAQPSFNPSKILSSINA